MMTTLVRLKYSFIYWLLAIGYSLSLTSSTQAQNITPPALPLPPSTPQPELETLPSLEEVLPQLEERKPKSSPHIIEAVPQTVLIKKFAIVGSTVFTPEELAVVLQPYVLRRLSFNELLTAQQAIDRLYLENGYITSGTFIPPQKLEDGIVTIEVIEGSVEAINIEGLKRLNSNYVRDRLKIATKAPLNRDKLLNALQLLQLNPLIDNLAAELTAGTRSGKSILGLNLKEANPWDITLSFDNYRTPSVGTDRRRIKLTHGNFLGLGDRLSLGYLNTDGSNSIDDINYSLPINSYNGRLDFRFSYTDSEIIEEPFAEFNIESENTNYEFTFRQPLIQQPTKDMALGLTFSRNSSQTTSGDRPLQLSRGADINGETNISTLRFFGEYTNRNQNQVFALLSQFSFGIDVFDATINDRNTPDSKFLTWRTQAQYLKLLNSSFSLLLRSSFQLANDGLVATEQFSLGGGLSVRGYRQDILLGDNGWFNSAEIRATILKIPHWNANLQLTPFLDFGKVWNSDDVTLATNTLLSTGVGLRLQVSDYLSTRLDYGIPLVELESQGNTLQESGVYFSVELNPL